MSRDKLPDTQLEAWDDIQDTVAGKRAVVLKMIGQNATLFELVKKTGWPVNRISGRVTELHRLGKIKDIGLRRRNPESGKSAIVWFPVGES